MLIEQGRWKGKSNMFALATHWRGVRELEYGLGLGIKELLNALGVSLM